jgi:hypothetical protein
MTPSLPATRRAHLPDTLASGVMPDPVLQVFRLPLAVDDGAGLVRIPAPGRKSANGLRSLQTITS